MQARRFSVIVPWRGGNPVREASLRRMLDCLYSCHTQFEFATYELILVEHPADEGDKRSRLMESVPEGICEFTYKQLPFSTAFNKSWCMNVGARLATTNDLLFVDADSLFGSTFLRSIDHGLRNIPSPNNNIVLCWDFLVALPGKDNPVSRHIEPHMLRTLGGIWYANRQFFWDHLGGMNENYNGYGGEDNDAYERTVVANGVPVSWLHYPLVHQYHDWEKPSDVAVKFFEISREHPLLVNKRLREAELGKLSGPTFIEMTDLV